MFVGQRVQVEERIAMGMIVGMLNIIIVVVIIISIINIINGNPDSCETTPLRGKPVTVVNTPTLT